MKGKLVNEYSKKDKNGDQRDNYVYKVFGTQDEIASAVESESITKIAEEDGTNGVKEGDCLVWLPFNGENVTLVITKANKVAVDTSADRKMVAMCSRLGKQGEAILERYLAKKLVRTNTSPDVKAPVAASAEIDALDLD